MLLLLLELGILCSTMMRNMYTIMYKKTLEHVVKLVDLLKYIASRESNISFASKHLFTIFWHNHWFVDAQYTISNFFVFSGVIDCLLSTRMCL
jgi:hypothetical protein